MILAKLPVKVMLAVPELVMVTPLPVVAVMLPVPTLRLTVMLPAAASTSTTDSPVKATLVSSLVV